SFRRSGKVARLRRAPGPHQSYSRRSATTDPSPAARQNAGPGLGLDGCVLSSSVTTGDRLARAEALAGTFGPRLRFGDLRQFDVDLLVGNAVEQVPDQIQPGAALVVGRDNVPGRLRRVGG